MPLLVEIWSLAKYLYIHVLGHGHHSIFVVSYFLCYRLFVKKSKGISLFSKNIDELSIVILLLIQKVGQLRLKLDRWLKKALE